MVWRREDPQGDEAAKVRYDLVPYLGRTCLDIGCGPKKVFPFFLGLDSGKDTQLFGIAMKPDIVGDCRRLPLFADGAFDTVFSSHTLEHIVEYRETLAEWWRLVAPGGHLILYLPHRDLYPRIGDPNGNPDHKHDFAPEDIERAMLELAVAGAPGWDLVVNETRDRLCEYSFLQIYRKTGGVSCVQSWMDPQPAKRAAIVRLGAKGDALWSSSVAWHLKREGYHVTMYAEASGREVLDADPNLDRIIEVPHQVFDDTELILYFIWEAQKYQRFVNLTGAVETRLLPHPNEPAYYWPDAARAKLMNGNYLEALHDVAGVPHEFHQKFYPTPEENAWAQAERRRLDGPVVVLAPFGSGLPKTWPHAQRFLELLAAAKVHVVVLGELKNLGKPLVAPPHYGHVAGMCLPLRQAFALAQWADAVVGVESAIVNAVAMEDNLKVVLLSHSSPENLTKHWKNTLSVEATGVPCHPCHRLHRAFEFCPQHPATGFAACASAADAETIAGVVLKYLQPEQGAHEKRVIPLKAVA